MNVVLPISVNKDVCEMRILRWRSVPLGPNFTGMGSFPAKMLIQLIGM